MESTGNTEQRRKSLAQTIASFVGFRSRRISGDKSILHTPSDSLHLVCKPEDNPNYILKACAKGNVELVNSILSSDPSKLCVVDDKGWTCLHHAAKFNRVEIIVLVHKKGADLNQYDLEGNTPLHVAVYNNCRSTVRYLLIQNVNATILNKLEMAPIHVAAITNKPEIIAELGKFPQLVNVDMQSRKDMTALHWAAKYDHYECASEILNCRPNPRLTNINGATCLHIAAQIGSLKTFELILSRVEWLGFAKKSLLAYEDKEGNNVLHTCVSSGKLCIVKVCLENGAEIDVLQTDRATPFHFACSHGNLGVTKLMYETHQSRRGFDEAKSIFALQDVSKMTPIHRAALFDHSAIVDYLLEQGSNMEYKDIDKRTPLLLAACKKSVNSVKILITAGADTLAKDKFGFTLMHYLVDKQLSGSNLVVDVLKILMRSANAVQLLNDKDCHGCSPLHYASKDGNLKFAESLISFGATVNLKDNDDQSPLHFAAKYGRIDMAKRLLESQIGFHIINEMDNEGNSALHVASANGCWKMVQLLCEKGAMIYKNFAGQSAFHLASIKGCVDTMDILLSFHACLLNTVCNKNNTALHYAAEKNKANVVEFLLTHGCQNCENLDERKPIDLTIENSNAESAMVFVKHERWTEFVRTPSKIYGLPLLGFIQFMPHIYKAVLDRCHTTAINVDPKSVDYWEKFNFDIIQAPDELMFPCPTKKALTSLNKMVECNRIELLNHHVSLYYLKMKWRAYGFNIFVINFLQYLFFVFLLTNLVVKSDRLLFKLSQSCFADDESTSCCSVSKSLLLIIVGIHIMKEFFQMFLQRLNYLLDSGVYLEWALYASTTIFIVSLMNINNTECEISRTTWHCGSIAIFLAWFNLLLYMARIDTIGLYVIMFQRIFMTIMKVVFIFSVLFVAFALVFYILLNSDAQGGFRTPFLSFMHIVMYMMGEWDYVEVYQKPYLVNATITGTGLRYPELSFFFLSLFIVLIPILFINLLIGLAVGDIEIIRRDAQLKKLAMQVEYHTKLERKLPKSYLRRVDKMEMVIFPNRLIEQGGFLSNILTRLRLFCFDPDLSHSVVKHTKDTRCVKVTKKDDENLTTSDFNEQKFKGIEGRLDNMTDLLKLIVTKMEITQEINHCVEP